MEARSKTPLLSAGHEDEWAEINKEEDEYRRASTRALSPSQRIQVGRKLSLQAVSLLAASIRAGHVSRQVLWSDDPPDLKRLMARTVRAEQMRVLLKDAEPHGGNAAETVKAFRPER